MEDKARTVTRAGWWIDQRASEPSDLAELLDAATDTDQPRTRNSDVPAPPPTRSTVRDGEAFPAVSFLDGLPLSLIEENGNKVRIRRSSHSNLYGPNSRARQKNRLIIVHYGWRDGQNARHQIKGPYKDFFKVREINLPYSNLN
jgi:hypothetical protein